MDNRSLVADFMNNDGHNMSDWDYKTPCKRRQKESNQRFYAKNRDALLHKRWVTSIKSDYGLSEDEYNKLFVAQQLSCAICGTTDFGDKRPFIDHCHKTGDVRGLLCSQCNSLLGFAKDNTYVLKKAIEYLLESRKKKLKNNK